PAHRGRRPSPSLCTTSARCRSHTLSLHDALPISLGRDVIPVMTEIAALPGGHKPLNFIHRLADGSTRHVQTYAGPIEIYGDKLRSEEHTSELQSRENLVCRLLLEKKKRRAPRSTT